MKLGIIGYGRRIRHMASEIMRKDSSCTVAAICDLRNDEIRTGWTEKDGPLPEFYNTPEELVAGSGVDGILIGTRCSLHTELALKVLPSGIPLFLEKPVATTMEDWQRLKRGMETGKSKVVVSFPLRTSPVVALVKEIVDSGKIGTIEHVQAVNNVPYGGVYFHNWYRDENETKGLFLQKATHDFDYIHYVLGLRPTEVCAMVSKQIYKGTKPAGLKCVDCEEKYTCPESMVVHKDGAYLGPYCCFAEDAGNEDSGSALVRYETGMHLAYSQNFFAKRKAASRGARFLGYKGTLEFDFYTDTVKVMMHQSPRVETYHLDPEEAHFGGDVVLAENFAALMKGEASSVSPLEAGLWSALLCIQARESALTGTFRQIVW